MTDVLDLKKTPEQVLLDGINQENGLSLTLSDVTLTGFNPDGGNDPGESSIVMTWIYDSTLVGDVTILYHRIDLASIFSLTGVVVKYVDLQNKTDLPVINQRLVDEIVRRYNVSLDLAHFDYAINGNRLTVTAKATNITYKGSVQIDYFIPAGIDAPSLSMNVSLFTEIHETIEPVF